jgi:SAM-dependent methyltransferase
VTPRKKEKLDKSFYHGENAKFYSESKWMARIQIETASRLLNLLEDERIGGKIKNNFQNIIILDLGCGNGFSMLVFEDKGFDRIIGIDISMDMLKENLKMQDKRENPARILINASIENLPIRLKSIDHIMSISAFNFILTDVMEYETKKEILTGISEDLYGIMNDYGKIAIEFYPKDPDIDLYLSTLKFNFIGGLIVDNPGLRKEKKYLILQKKEELNA